MLLLGTANPTIRGGGGLGLRTYLAHHELESEFIIIVVIVIIIIVVVVVVVVVVIMIIIWVS